MQEEERKYEKEQAYAKKSFDGVADKYDEIALFKTSASHVVELINNHTNLRKLQILDVACGTGNVAFACAKDMPEAMVDAIDISEDMLNKAKENATNLGLKNINFFCKDVSKLDGDKKYHVITCSYALFFLPHAPRILESLISLLKVRGIVIFTSFTQEAFAVSSHILMPLLREYGSPSAKEYDMDKWENLKQKKDIERLCTLAYVSEMKIITKEIRYAMSIDEWWALLNNTGYKGMLMELSDENYEKVKKAYYQAMFKHADMDGEVELVADSYFVVAK